MMGKNSSSAKKQKSLTCFFSPKQTNNSTPSKDNLHSSPKNPIQNTPKRPINTPNFTKTTETTSSPITHIDIQDSEDEAIDTIKKPRKIRKTNVIQDDDSDAPQSAIDLSSFMSPSSKEKLISTPFKSTSTFSNLPMSSSKKSARQEKFTEKNLKRYEWLLNIKDKQSRDPSHPDYDPRTLLIPKSAWNDFTPFEKQYWEIKSNHWDKIVFFKKGKFFELFEKDATIGHQEFDLKLVDRVNMRMVGVPESSFEHWAAQFIAKGYMVAKVDQLENSIGKAMKDRQSTNKKKDDIIKRELTSVLTTGTLVDAKLLTNDMSTYCMSIKEYATADGTPPKFGISFVDTATAEFNICSFQDDIDKTILETVIMQTKPKELVLQKNNLSKSSLKILTNNLPNTSFNYLTADSEYWSSLKTIDEFDKLQYFDALWPHALRTFKKDDLAMSSMGGLVSYLRSLKLDLELVSAKNFSSYDPVQRSNSLVLDGQTLINLEIFENTHDGSDKGTLFKLINHCETPFGKRQFKRWVCHPLKSVSEIKDRQDAVDDLNSVKGLVTEVKSLLKKLPDLERVISRIHAGSCKVRDFLKTIRALKIIMSIPNEFQSDSPDFKSKFLSNILKHGFSDKLKENLEFFENAFDNSEAMENDSIKPYSGYDMPYDEASKVVENMETQFEKYRKECEGKLNCSVQYRDIGKEIYQIEVPVKTKVPTEWTVTSKTQSVCRYYNSKVRVMVKEMQEARETLDETIRDVKKRMFEKFDEKYESWLQVIKNMADLDCLISLANISNYLGETSCRPEIIDSEDSFFEAKGLKHPCIMTGVSGDFIPNDTYLGKSSPNMILLTGPNMGGKSTLLRQTCVAVILAQLGCYVPAESFRLTPVDRIFTRIGASDNIMAGQSTFMVELAETSKILKEATPKSLVILDELGRGTSTFDGYAIAYAVLNHLLVHTQCLGLFSTHYGTLTKELEDNPLISLKYMGFFQDQVKNQITFLYKLTNGRCPASYGMNVARIAGVPEDIVIRAEKISKQFDKAQKSKQKKELDMNLYRQSEFCKVKQILDNNAIVQEEKLLKMIWKGMQTHSNGLE